MESEEVLRRVKEDSNILHTAKRRKSNWIGHVMFFAPGLLIKL
jgi:hypothetical protein